MGELWLVRHGETAWSITGQHTGLTDLALTPDGERQAAALAPRLARPWAAVLTSPLQRAARTAELAGLVAEPEKDLVEWDYGPAEGLTTAQMSVDQPWSVWDDIPLGETLAQVAERTARVLDEVAPALEHGDVCLVAHGHLLRILTAVYLGLPPLTARHLLLSPAHIARLGCDRTTRALLEWNG